MTIFASLGVQYHTLLEGKPLPCMLEITDPETGEDQKVALVGYT